MWEINIGWQTQGFLYSLILGCVLCLVYDVIRTIHLSGKSDVVTVFFEDIVFWLICTFLVFCFLMGVTKGQVRGYVLFGALLGFLIFRMTVSAVLMVVLKKIFRILAAIKRIIRRFYRRICFKINRVFDALGKKTAIIVKKWIKYAKKLLKKGRDMLYTMRNRKRVEVKRKNDA